jgi:hypothetical protein
MSWEDILKDNVKDESIEALYKKWSKLHVRAKSLIDNIMADKEKRTINEILNLLSDKWKTPTRRTLYGIPTIHQIQNYVGKSNDYESVIVDTLTGNELQNRLKPYHVTHWRRLK